MKTIDWVFAGVVIILAARCFVRGFVQELLSVAAYAVGIFSGLLFSNSLIDFANKQFSLEALPPTVQYIAAFVLCFVAGFLIMKLIEKLIREGLEAANLEIFDRILGLALGLAEGLAVVALALVIIEIQPFFDSQKLISGSLFADTILPIIGPAINETIKPALDGSGVPLDLKGLMERKN